MADPRAAAKGLAHRINILGTTYLVLEDGKITTEDAKPIAWGVLNSIIIANEASLFRFANARGYTAMATRAVSVVGVTYIAGVTASYLVDPEDGVKNFHTFLSMVRDDPLMAAQVTVDNLELLGEHIYSTARPHIDEGIETMDLIIKQTGRFLERKFEESIQEQKERLTRFLPSPILF